MTLRTLFSLTLILQFSLSFCQGYSFWKEDITMRIDREYFYVSGIYFINSEEKDTLILSYPFPIDSLYGAVDSLFIFNLTTESQIFPFRQNRQSAAFVLDFSLEKEMVLQISYRQKLLSKRAEYILLTTKSWQGSFEKANYQLIVPLGMQITHFSIAPGDYQSTDRSEVFYWEYYNYFPEKNMIFEFE